MCGVKQFAQPGTTARQHRGEDSESAEKSAFKTYSCNSVLERQGALAQLDHLAADTNGAVIADLQKKC